MLTINDTALVAVAAAALLVTPAFSGCLSPPGEDPGGDDGTDDGETFIGSCDPAGTIPRDDTGGGDDDHATEVPGDTSFPAPSGNDSALALDALADRRITAPGGTVAFPLTVGPNATDAGYDDVAPEVVEAEGGITTRSTGAAALAPNGTGFFVHASVPDDAAEDVYNLTLRARADDTVGPHATVQVHVTDPDDQVDSGEQVQAGYVGRFVNGTVFATSQSTIDASPIPKATFYQGGGPFQPLNVTVGPNAQFIEGFNEGLVGVGVGHNASFLVPPSKGYGNATTTDATARNETINRTITQERVFNLSRQRLQRQGLINESHERGDTIDVGQGPQAQTYRLTFLNETQVELTLEVEEGDTRAHYDQWPNSSEAVMVNDTHVEYYVTPTVDLCEKFTWQEGWENASMIINATEENLTIQHTPDVGTKYTPQSRFPGQSSAERTVIEVEAEEIVYREPNQHPLAGKTLVFDVSVFSAEESSGQQTQQRR
jgi:FKBP-type peptidyl-prolyl cis-trans isomerase 2